MTIVTKFLAIWHRGIDGTINVMEEKRMTEGEYRVGVTFNPSKDPKVDSMKQRCAELIDEMLEYAKDRNAPGARCGSEAATCFETAAMWAVKAITKQPKPE